MHAADPASPFAGHAATSADAPPRLAHAFTLHVTVDAAQDRGIVYGQQIRFVRITGGIITGPRLAGTVLPGGGDWQAVDVDGLTPVEARYAVRATDGTAIEIVNVGVRVATPEVTARLGRGWAVAVAAADYYFCTAPRFTVADGSHGWLRRTQFVARGVRHPREVEFQVFAVA